MSADKGQPGMMDRIRQGADQIKEQGISALPNPVQRSALRFADAGLNAEIKLMKWGLAPLLAAVATKAKAIAKMVKGKTEEEMHQAQAAKPQHQVQQQPKDAPPQPKPQPTQEQIAARVKAMDTRGHAHQAQERGRS